MITQLELFRIYEVNKIQMALGFVLIIRAKNMTNILNLLFAVKLQSVKFCHKIAFLIIKAVNSSVVGLTTRKLHKCCVSSNLKKHYFYSYFAWSTPNEKHFIDYQEKNIQSTFLGEPIFVLCLFFLVKDKEVRRSIFIKD